MLLSCNRKVRFSILKHTTKFTALILAAGTCFSGTICTFAESTNSADAANATEVFSTPLYTSGLYSTDEQPEGVKVTHNICLDYDNNLMKDNYLIQNESDTDVSFDSTDCIIGIRTRKAV